MSPPDVLFMLPTMNESMIIELKIQCTEDAIYFNGTCSINYDEIKNGLEAFLEQTILMNFAERFRSNASGPPNEFLFCGGYKYYISSTINLYNKKLEIFQTSWRN
jgi:hypothetical protein